MRDVSHDAVDEIVAQWRAERPDLDPSAKEVTGRVLRLGTAFQQRYAEAFRALGLGEGEYGVLAALRRAGAPFELTPTALARQRMMSTGGMTLALDRLERAGLVARRPNPADRRGVLVRLTAAGRRKADAAMERHVEIERELVGGLTVRERRDLVELLRKLLLAIEQP